MGFPAKAQPSPENPKTDFGRGRVERWQGKTEEICFPTLAENWDNAKPIQRGMRQPGKKQEAWSPKWVQGMYPDQ